MQNIVRLTPDTIIRLSEAASRADAKGRSMRVQTGNAQVDCRGVMVTRTWVKWDVGDGTGWTEPYFGE